MQVTGGWNSSLRGEVERLKAKIPTTALWEKKHELEGVAITSLLWWRYGCLFAPETLLPYPIPTSLSIPIAGTIERVKIASFNENKIVLRRPVKPEFKCKCKSYDFCYCYHELEEHYSIKLADIDFLEEMLNHLLADGQLDLVLGNRTQPLGHFSMTCPKPELRRRPVPEKILRRKFEGKNAAILHRKNRSARTGTDDSNVLR